MFNTIVQNWSLIEEFVTLTIISNSSSPDYLMELCVETLEAGESPLFAVRSIADIRNVALGYGSYGFVFPVYTGIDSSELIHLVLKTTSDRTEAEVWEWIYEHGDDIGRPKVYGVVEIVHNSLYAILRTGARDMTPDERFMHMDALHQMTRVSQDVYRNRGKNFEEEIATLRCYNAAVGICKFLEDFHIDTGCLLFEVEDDNTGIDERKGLVARDFSVSGNVEVEIPRMLDL